MRGVHYSACSLCYKKIAQFHQKCSLMRDCSLFRRLLLPEYTVLRLRPVLKLQRGAKIARFSYWVYNNIYFIKQQEIIPKEIRRSNHGVSCLLLIVYCVGKDWLVCRNRHICRKPREAEEFRMFLMQHHPTACRWHATDYIFNTSIFLQRVILR